MKDTDHEGREGQRRFWKEGNFWSEARRISGSLLGREIEIRVLLEEENNTWKDIQGGEDNLKEDSKCSLRFGTMEFRVDEKLKVFWETKQNKSALTPHIKEFGFSLENDGKWLEEHKKESDINSLVFYKRSDGKWKERLKRTVRSTRKVVKRIWSSPVQTESLCEATVTTEDKEMCTSLCALKGRERGAYWLGEWTWSKRVEFFVCFASFRVIIIF